MHFVRPGLPDVAWRVVETIFLIKLDLPGNIATLANEKNWVPARVAKFFHEKKSPPGGSFPPPGKTPKKPPFLRKLFVSRPGAGPPCAGTDALRCGGSFGRSAATLWMSDRRFWRWLQGGAGRTWLERNRPPPKVTSEKSIVCCLWAG